LCRIAGPDSPAPFSSQKRLERVVKRGAAYTLTFGTPPRATTSAIIGSPVTWAMGHRRSSRPTPWYLMGRLRRSYRRRRGRCGFDRHVSVDLYEGLTFHQDFAVRTSTLPTAPTILVFSDARLTRGTSTSVLPPVDPARTRSLFTTIGRREREPPDGTRARRSAATRRFFSRYHQYTSRVSTRSRCPSPTRMHPPLHAHERTAPPARCLGVGGAVSTHLP